jgi:hypothetical protein
MALLTGAGVARGQWGVGGWGAGTGGTDISVADPARFAFRPWVSANGTYSQVLGTQQLPAGARREFYGYGGAAGISGARAWERTSLGLFYTANYQRYSGTRVTEGMSQVAGVSVSHQLTERTGVFASQLAGSSLGGFGYGAPAGIFGGWGLAGSALLPQTGLFAAPLNDLAANGLVDNELFSTRVNFYATAGGIHYQPTLRWSFSAGAQAGYVRRKGRGLQDLNTAGVFGQSAYRISQRTAVGASYGFSTFSYPKFFGDNRAQFVSLFLSHQISPQTTVAIGFGGFRMDTRFLGAVAVDPEIAALLGVSTRLEVQERQFYGWQGSATVSRSWRAWGASLGYSHGVNPGNGVVLASKRDAVFGSAGRSFGRVSFGAYGGFFRWSGLLQNTRLTSGHAGLSTGFRVKGDLFFGMNGGYSFFDSPAQPRRWQRFVSAHLTWSPSAAAFRF